MRTSETNVENRFVSDDELIETVNDWCNSLAAYGEYVEYHTM